MIERYFKYMFSFLRRDIEFRIWRKHYKKILLIVGIIIALMLIAINLPDASSIAAVGGSNSNAGVIPFMEFFITIPALLYLKYKKGNDN